MPAAWVPHLTPLPGVELLLRGVKGNSDPQAAAEPPQGLPAQGQGPLSPTGHPRHLLQPPGGEALPGEAPGRGCLKKAREPTSINSGFIEKQQHWGPCRQRGHTAPLPPAAHTPTGSLGPPPHIPGPTACLHWNSACHPLWGCFGTSWGLGTVASHGLTHSEPQQVKPAAVTCSGLTQRQRPQQPWPDSPTR